MFQLQENKAWQSVTEDKADDVLLLTLKEF